MMIVRLNSFKLTIKQVELITLLEFKKRKNKGTNQLLFKISDNTQLLIQKVKSLLVPNKIFRIELKCTSLFQLSKI